MLSFHKMVVEGFASIKHIEFSWSGGERGIIILSARNGSGKSKLINALYWALFGKSISGSIQMWEHLQDKDYKGTKVEINFTVDNNEYKIIRCSDYKGHVEGRAGKSGLFFYRGDKLDTGRDKRGIQERINTTLGYTPELFLNSIIFGQKQQRLMDDKSSDKKRFFEEAFEVLVFQRAYLKAKEGLQGITSHLGQLSNQVALSNQSVKNLEEKIQLLSQLEENWEKEMKAKKDRLKRDIKEVKEEIKELSESRESQTKDLERQLEEVIEQRKKVGRATDIYFKQQRKVFQTEATINSIKKEITQIEKQRAVYERRLKNMPGVCPECGRPFDAKHLKETKRNYEGNINSLSSQILSKEESIKEHESILLDEQKSLTRLKENVSLANSLDTKIHTLENNLQDIRDNTFRVDKLSKKLKSLKRELADLEEETYKPEPGNNIEALQSRIDCEKAVIKNLKKQINKQRVEKLRYEFAQHTFSNKGIKPWLFSMLLEQVNIKLEEYEPLSGFRVVFWVDQESANGDIRVLVERYGTVVPYEDLSGGQQQLINLTTIFAINDVIQETKPCDLFIGDELFESLDTTNVEVVGNILQDKADEKCIFLVTHLLDFNLQNSKVIKLENKDGYTAIVD